jgi:hypothetical protein
MRQYPIDLYNYYVNLKKETIRLSKEKELQVTGQPVKPRAAGGPVLRCTCNVENRLKWHLECIGLNKIGSLSEFHLFLFIFVNVAARKF